MDGSIHLETGAEPFQFKGLDVSLNGILIANALGGPIRFWDLRSGKALRKPELRVEPNIQRNKSLALIALSPNGKCLLAQQEFSLSVVFDAETGRQLFVLSVPISGHGIFSRDSKTLVTWDFSELTLWNVSTGKRVRCPMRTEQDVDCLALSSDARIAALGTGSGTLILLDTTTGDRLQADTGPENSVTEARFLNGGRLVAGAPNGHAWAATSDRRIRIWDSLTGKGLDSPFKLAESLKQLSANSETFIGSTDKELTVTTANKLQAALKFERGLFIETRHLCPLAISPNGKLFATGQEIEKFFSPDSRPADRKLQLRQAATGEVLREIATFSSGQDSFYFSPDNRTIVGWFEPGKYEHLSDGPPLQLWDVSSGKSLLGFRENLANVGAFAFSSDGRFIASTEKLANKPFIRLREVFTGRTSSQIDDQLDFLGGLAFSPDSRHLAYCQPDGDISIRDLHTHRMVLKLAGHEGRVNSLDFAPDGRRLLSSGEDGTILVWDVAELLHTKAAPSKVNQPVPDLIHALQGTDAEKAFSATHHLVSMGDRAVNPLSDAVSGILVAAEPHVVKADQIDRWITDLDSSEFKIRQAATDNLRANGDLAESAIRSALQKRPVLEIRRRLELVLTSIENGTPLSPSLVFAIRAIEVLERIGSAQAKALLSKLAAAPTFARIQEEARLSLERLEREAVNSTRSGTN